MDDSIEEPAAPSVVVTGGRIFAPHRTESVAVDSGNICMKNRDDTALHGNGTEFDGKGDDEKEYFDRFYEKGLELLALLGA